MGRLVNLDRFCKNNNLKFAILTTNKPYNSDSRFESNNFDLQVIVIIRDLFVVLFQPAVHYQTREG